MAEPKQGGRVWDRVLGVWVDEGASSPAPAPEPTPEPPVVDSGDDIDGDDQHSTNPFQY